MGSVDWLHDFYAMIAEDPRITITHVSLYMAIRFEWENNCFEVLMEIDRSAIMQLAKISSTVTYNKSMHALHDFGYIIYSPFFGRRKSELRLRKW